MATSQQSARGGATGARSQGQEEVQVFLDRLARAITAGDGKAAAALWAVPALVLGDTEARAIATREEVAQFFGGAKEQYNAKGITPRPFPAGCRGDPPL
jgi:hypothetical protein